MVVTFWLHCCLQNASVDECGVCGGLADSCAILVQAQMQMTQLTAVSLQITDCHALSHTALLHTVNAASRASPKHCRQSQIRPTFTDTRLLVVQQHSKCTLPCLACRVYPQNLRELDDV